MRMKLLYNTNFPMRMKLLYNTNFPMSAFKNREEQETNMADHYKIASISAKGAQNNMFEAVTIPIKNKVPYF